jgi:hypothetical protein
MTFSEISNLRLLNQKITKPDMVSPGELISQMGAIQAQDFPSAKMAVGKRLLNATDASVEEAFNRGEIIRMHLMRPTWHFVSPDDVYWMLELTAPQIRVGTNSRHKHLELTSKELMRCNRLIEKALTERKEITRAELGKLFTDEGIRMGDNRLSHILLCAELDGIICCGPLVGRKETYALLSERVPVKRLLTHEESLAELAKKYFTSHGPATLRDFIWWSGLPVRDAKRGLESVKTSLIARYIGDETYWSANFSPVKNSRRVTVHLLPAYDEFLISYRDRTASLGTLNNKRTISSNGIFYPVILVNGQVSGVWKRSVKKDTVVIDANFFEEPGNMVTSLFEKECYVLGRFLNNKAVLTFRPTLK